MIAWNARVPPEGRCVRSANGTINDVSNTSSKLNPSTPTRYSAPTAGIHSCRSMNCSPGALVLKLYHSATAHDAEMALNVSATGRSPRFGQTDVARAPTSGITMIAEINPTMRKEEEAQA